MPTFLELAGVAVPADMQGLSLLPLLKGGIPPTGAGRSTTFLQYPAEHMVKRHYGVRNDAGS
ncbi:MAG: sulfatase/phosphatase domain-containing protein [Alistipes onderdonkii]